MWLNSATQEGLTKDFAGIASHLDLAVKNDPNQPRVIKEVKQWFEAHDGWLLIFDNANDLGMVREFIPRTNRGHVLLTTWDQSVGALASKVEVLPLDQDDGAFLLLRRAEILGDGDSLADATDEDRDAALEITREVGGLPLALDQAGAYIKETGRSPAKYLELYRTHGAQLRRDESGKWSRDYPETVATTWLMAFGELPSVALSRGCRLASPLLVLGSRGSSGRTHPRGGTTC